jgi:nucleoid-associated protein YejK
LTNQILQVKNELEESQRQSIKQVQAEKRLKEELEIAKSQYLDMQRAERTVRIDLEQSRRTVSWFLIEIFLG